MVMILKPCIVVLSGMPLMGGQERACRGTDSDDEPHSY